MIFLEFTHKCHTNTNHVRIKYLKMSQRIRRIKKKKKQELEETRENQTYPDKIRTLRSQITH